MRINNSNNNLTQQLALDLPLKRHNRREDLIEGDANRLAIELIDAWPDWPGNIVVLAGPVGSGKSHISGIWAQKSGARITTMSQLEKLGVDRDNERPLLLENADAGAVDETSLFHILNAKKSARATLLITARSWPSDWKITLPDLNSRLRAAQLVELGEPDDSLLRGVLFKLFSERQLPIEPNVIDYLVVRMERSLEAANKIVSHLDNSSLAQNRKITRQLAGDVLASWENK